VLDEYPAMDGRPALGREGPIRQGEVFLKHLGTTIGTPAESWAAPPGIVRAQRYARDFGSSVLQQAARVIRGALERFGVNTPDMFTACHAVFAKMYKVLPPRSPSRNVQVLGLAAVFRTAQVRRVAISCRAIHDLLVEMDRPQSSFRIALVATSSLFPRPDLRDVVLTLVSQLVSRLNLPASISAVAVRIARQYGRTFAARSKSAVAAAGVVAAAVLAEGARQQYPLSVVAEAAGVASSAVSRCINAACDRLNAPLAQNVVLSGTALASLFGTRAEPRPSLPSLGQSMLEEKEVQVGEVKVRAGVSPVPVPGGGLLAGLPMGHLDCKVLQCPILSCPRRRCSAWEGCCVGSRCKVIVESLVIFAKDLVFRFNRGHRGDSLFNALFAGTTGFDPPPPAPA